MIQIEDKTADDLAMRLYCANAELLTARDLLTGTPAQHIEEARLAITHVKKALVNCGALDPRDQARRDRGLEELPEPSMTQMCSPASIRYAEAIRAAAVACRQMETERGIGDGFAEILEDAADGAEMEAFGPIGMRE